MFKKRSIALAVTIALMITLLAPMPVMAASGGGPLVKNVKQYNYNTTNKKWEISNKRQYTYNKAYPAQIDFTSYSSETKSPYKYKYKMKKNKPKSAKEINPLGKKATSLKYNKKGLRTKSSYNNYFKRQGETRTYKYNKNGFATSQTYKYKYKYSNGTKYVSDSSTDYYTYNYSMSKGLPKRMICTYAYNYGSGRQESSTRTEVKYNKKGLITSISYLYSDGTVSSSYKVSYKTKKGKIASATIYYTDYDGKKTPRTKISFGYTKTKVAKARYANMINSFIANATTARAGAYNWY